MQEMTFDDYLMEIVAALDLVMVSAVGVVVIPVDFDVLFVVFVVVQGLFVPDAF
jgi:hypothetical protein